MTLADTGQPQGTMIRSAFPRYHRLGLGRTGGFTLVELLAVVMIIALMVGLVLGVAGYVQKRSARSQAESEIRTLELAIEQFKIDQGYYPTSSPVRISASGWAAVTNSALLYQQLVVGSNPTGKTYLQPSSKQIANTTVIHCWSANLKHFIDPYGQAYIYYCRPTMARSVSNYIATCNGARDWGEEYGGQTNCLTFDLFSMGPDGMTHVQGSQSASYGAAWSWNGVRSTETPSLALDDVTNWK